EAKHSHDGERMKQVSWSKADGEFGAQLFFTDKPNQLFGEWNKPSPGIEIPTTAVVHRGQPLVAVVVFTGCGADAKGLAQSTVRYTAYRPDGTVYGKPAAGELWVDKPPPARDQLQLGVLYVGTVIEPDDPLGEYKIVAEVVDHVTGKSLKLSRKFTAKDRAAEDELLAE
ncbi:MAG: hypothetical protein AB7G28_26950, partial [Pirellulales bacterium]